MGDWRELKGIEADTVILSHGMGLPDVHGAAMSRQTQPVEMV